MIKQRILKSGFTLIELLVTIGVFLLITGVVLARYRSFGIGAEFSNAVENVVLSLREAQVYGAGSKVTGSGMMCGSPPSAFSCAYGVHFTNNGASYVIFVDQDGNKDYAASGSEAIQTIDLPEGISITIPPALSDLDIVFKRPFPDAIINDTLDSASITVTSITKSHTITVTSAGQISVQ